MNLVLNLYSLNSLLPPDIRIDKLEVVNNDFHARYSAKGKIYSYAIDLEAKNPLEYQILYPCPYDIDVDKFVDVLTHFVGIHNFKNFSSKENDEDNFVRQIFDINVKISGKRVDVTLHGNGFMRYMIRYIIGTSLEVARGKLTIEDVDALLDASSIRNIVSWKAPASGLTLLEVVY